MNLWLNIYSRCKTHHKDLVKSTAGIVGENIVIARFTRMAVGETAKQE